MQLISFIGGIFLNYLRTSVSAVSFENVFFTILPGHILNMECPFGHSYGKTYKAQLSSKSKRTEAVFHLSNRLNAFLNLKKIELFILIFIRNKPVLALKISKRVWACILGRRVMFML